MVKFSDIDFFLKKNIKDNDIQLKTDVSAVAQSVKNIVLTDPGERIFAPYFGGGIPGTLFNNYDWREAVLMEEQLKTALTVYEPRITVESINIEYIDQTTLSIDLSFSLNSNPSSLITLNIQK